MGSLEGDAEPVSVSWWIDDWGIHPDASDSRIRLESAAAHVQRRLGKPGSPIDRWRASRGLRSVDFDVIVPAGCHEFSAKPQMIEGSFCLTILLGPEVFRLDGAELEQALEDAITAELDRVARSRRWSPVNWLDDRSEHQEPADRGTEDAVVDLESAFETFWDVLAAIPPVQAESAQQRCDRLAGYLATLGAGAIGEFNTALPWLLRRLDRRSLLEQSVWDVEDDPNQSPLPLTSDTFLLARCAVVLAGRETYERVAAQPSSFAGTRDLGAGSLLEVGERALELSSAEDLRGRNLPSYETGSNPEFTDSR